MNQHLFDMYSNGKDGLNVVVKSYFDRMYTDGCLLEVIEYINKKCGFSTDGAYCYFPDMDEYDEYFHFEGVKFASGYPPEEEDIVIVTEEICFQYVRLACERYLQLHPEDAEKVNSLIAQIPV